MNPEHRKLLYLIPVLAWLGGCAASGPLVASPSVELSGVRIGKASFESQTFLLSFHVSNPNPFPLPVQSVRYNVMLGDERFASGETPGKFAIPAGGDGDFDITVDLDLLRQSGRLRSLLLAGASDDLEYQLSGTLALDLPLVKPLPFSSSGVVSIAAR